MAYAFVLVILDITVNQSNKDTGVRDKNRRSNQILKTILYKETMLWMKKQKSQ